MTSRMIRSLFTFASAALLAATAFGGRAAAQAPAPASPADPNRAATAPPAGGDAGAPLSNEELEAAEAAVLGSPVAAPKPARVDRAATPSRPPPAPPPSTASDRRRSADRDAARDETGKEIAFALELGTTGFASGALQGGLFAGVRLPSGMIIGGAIDYMSSSFKVSGGTSPPVVAVPRQSTSAFRLGAGLRYPLISTGDGRVDLFAAADAGIVQAGSEFPNSDGSSVSNLTAFGFSAAAGPGLRFWIHEHVAIAYAARARVIHLSGAVGAFSQATTPFSADADAESTDFRFEGSFQILGVF